MDNAQRDRVLEHASRLHDRRVRRYLLSVLFGCRASPSGWVGAVKLRDTVEVVIQEDERLQSDPYWIGLLRDLCLKGLAEERLKSRRRGETFSLRHLEYRILAPGISLHLQSVPPDPDIDDDRILPG